MLELLQEKHTESRIPRCIAARCFGFLTDVLTPAGKSKPGVYEKQWMAAFQEAIDRLQGRDKPVVKLNRVLRGTVATFKMNLASSCKCHGYAAVHYPDGDGELLQARMIVDTEKDEIRVGTPVLFTLFVNERGVHFARDACPAASMG